MASLENTQENLAALRALLKRLPQRDWNSILGASSTGGAPDARSGSNKPHGSSPSKGSEDGKHGTVGFLILQPAYRKGFLPGEALISESEDNSRLPDLNMNLRKRLHNDAVRLASWRWGVETSGPGTEGGNWAVGVPEAKEIHLEIEFDGAAMGILEQVLSGAKFHRVAMFCCQSVTSAEKDNELDYYIRIDLWDAWLKSLDMSWAEGRKLPQLSLDFQYWNIEFRYKPLDRATHKMGSEDTQQYYQWYPQSGKAGGPEQDDKSPDFDKE